MEIRQAQWEDLPFINEIYNQAVRRKFCTAHLVPVSLEQRKRRFRAHDAKRFPVIVVPAEEGITGWISLSPYRVDRQSDAAPYNYCGSCIYLLGADCHLDGPEPDQYLPA